MHGQVGICHNGNIVNATEVRERLVRAGSIFQTNSDTEVVLHLYARSQAGSIEDAVVESVTQLTGAFSFALITKDSLIAVRDPHGFRPLALGRLGDSWAVTSETCALDLIGFTYVRDVEPGEVLIIGQHGVRSIKPFPNAPLSHCIFEHVYFARPDSDVFGQSVNEVRTDLGRALARETGIDADVVVPIPDSGVCAAIGYSEESKVPMRFGLIRNHYVGRTFIEPAQSIRHFGVKVKLNTGAQHHRGPARRPDRRLDRARHHQPQDREDGARRRRRRSAPAHQLPADRVAVFLRRRHAAAPRADRRDPYAGRDQEVRRRRYARLPEHGRAAVGGEDQERVVLHVVLHRQLSGRVPAR